MAIPAQKPPAASAPGAKPAAAAPAGPQVIKLKKGELLFAEGENSRAMYLLKNGMIRIFKKKGNSSIEIDTIHTGQIIGELAFLDGNPRSASGEALTNCELVEISGTTFTQTLGAMPDWLKLLLKTVVGRLRTASTRIRQLESASTAVDYSDGKKNAAYTYLATHEVLKTLTAIILVSTRYGKQEGPGTMVKLSSLNKFSNQIMNVPVAKVTTMLDVLSQLDLASVDEKNSEIAYIKDVTTIEQAMNYINEENLLEASKKHDVSHRGFYIMSLIAKHIGKYPKNEETGMAKVNIGEIKKTESAAAGGKEVFRYDEFAEIAKIGYATNINIKSADEAYSDIKPDVFVHAFKMQRVVKAIAAVNEQKRADRR